MKRSCLLIVLLFSLLFPVGLQAQDTAPLRVLATTTLIADVALNVGGDRVEVTALVPPGADVHAFKPAPQDAVIIQQAQVVLVNGANLEEALLALVESAASVEPTVVSYGVPVLAFGGHDEEHDHDDAAAHDEEDHASEAAEPLGRLGIDVNCDSAEQAADDHADDEHAHGICDPHVWLNPANVQIWADNIAAAFAAADPDHAAFYEANAAAYKEQLVALDLEVETILSRIPEDRRLLVTNHDFLAYLAARYDLKVVGTVIPSVSTMAEPAPQDVAALIATIRETGAPAIFAEVFDPGTLARVIAQEAGEVAVVTLFSGSLSAADGPAPTYIDYVRYNAQAIAEALGGA
jgi:ABC-type Zn uptake system ZnuABC Zn-binding protein ZnuA